MARVQSFAPVAHRSARVLILGSMPGVASLKARQYYAHPRNAFWPVMGDLLGFDPAMPYAARLAVLSDAGIALWDVLRECHRTGSLDSAIDPASLVANDFATFFAAHPGIVRVGFNGSLAAESFRRHVVPSPRLDYRRLPSTSPAHAALSLAQKTEAWRAALMF
jgi:hypoxanthine-DNA glycosylase